MLEQKISSLEEEIQRNKYFLEVLFDTIPNPIFYKDKEGIYQHGNEAFTKTILGLNKNEIVGKSLYDLPEHIPKKLADIYYEKDQELFNNPGTQNYEAEVKCSDNTIRHYNFYKAVFSSESDEVEGIVGVMLDISEHKKTMKDLADKNNLLSELSITDPLTQLYNRRYFQEIFERKTSMLMHNEQPFALMLIDVDFFKDYNDTFGHQKGDNVLKSISKFFQLSFSRPIDFIFRLGGEEFAILFSFTKIEQAIHSAQELLKGIEDLNIPAGNTTTSNSVTISMGLGLINHIHNKKSNLMYLYEEIDKLLYQAKENGRNQCSYKEYNK